MEDCKYTAKDCNIKLYIKIHNYLAGVFARKDLLKEFCENNGIDYKPIKDRKYKTPSQYIFSHSEAKYLSGIRDKIILVFYEEYKNKQIGLLQASRDIEKDINVEEDILEAAKEELSKHRNSLKSAKDPQIKITLQNLIETTKTKIENGKIQLANKIQEGKEYELLYKTNIEDWCKQVDIIDNVYSIQKSRFDKSASRKISKYLNYTKVYSEVSDYSDSVKQIIKGEINETEK